MNQNRKILNDPVYGFINLPDGLLAEIVHHSYFQRLRRIRQLGMSDLVYPGATHTRFLHTLGSYHLMNLAISVLREKGIDISDNNAKAVQLAILLHDIGHGPFSHALEDLIVPNISHEEISLAFMKYFNAKYEGALDEAIDVFTGRSPHNFLHELVSSQLDTDRLDYLKRDSFFTGVSEGVISTDRIIKMLNVIDDRLVVDIKGLYSVEKFLIARRLMYWQVYLHKTVVASEMLLRKVIMRARELTMQGQKLWASDSLLYFLKNNHFELTEELIKNFALLDDTDVITSLKVWQNCDDKVLSLLSKMYVNRSLFKIKLQKEPFDEEFIALKKMEVVKKFGMTASEAEYFVVTDHLTNNAYKPDSGKIMILKKDGQTADLAEVSDMFDHEMLYKTVKKYFLCYPRGLA
ncbi:MAG: phosphohydrolase [Salinivirgaceae bacterium]|nr:MAG: phosphohydrolase [Salinivirgaceae bacterium]